VKCILCQQRVYRTVYRETYDCFLLQFHEPAVADRMRKIIPAVYLNVPGIKGFQVPELFEVKEDKNGDYLTVGQDEFAVPASFATVFLEDVSLHCRVEIEAEFVCKAVNFHYICIHKRQDLSVRICLIFKL
jgi:hypothetical protein